MLGPNLASNFCRRISACFFARLIGFVVIVKAGGRLVVVMGKGRCEPKAARAAMFSRHGPAMA